MSVETDASVAKQCCSVGYAIKRRIEEMARAHRLMHRAVDSLTACLVGQLQALAASSGHCEDQLVSWNRQFQLWQKLHQGVKDVFRLSAGSADAQPASPGLDGDPSLQHHGWSSLDTLLQLPKSQQSEILTQMLASVPVVQQLNQRVVRDGALTKEWTAASRPIAALNGVCGKAVTYVTRLKESWQHLLRDRAARGRSSTFPSKTVFYRPGRTRQKTAKSNFIQFSRAFLFLFKISYFTVLAWFWRLGRRNINGAYFFSKREVNI